MVQNFEGVKSGFGNPPCSYEPEAITEDTARNAALFKESIGKSPVRHFGR